MHSGEGLCILCLVAVIANLQIHPLIFTDESLGGTLGQKHRFHLHELLGCWLFFASQKK